MKNSSFWSNIISLLSLLLLWELLAQWQQSQVLPPPSSILSSLFYEASDGDLWKHLWATLRRVVICFFVAMALGGLLGSWMGISRRVNAWLDMWLIVLLNIPALVTIVLCYLWLGLIEAAALTAVIINKVPNVAVIFREGVRSFNSRYRDLSKAYRLSVWHQFWYVWVPQLVPYTMAAARSGLSLIWKIVLVVELLGRSEGIGFQIHFYFQLFDVASLMAYSLSFILVVQALEWGVLQPLERRARRWQSSATTA